MDSTHSLRTRRRTMKHHTISRRRMHLMMRACPAAAIRNALCAHGGPASILVPDFRDPRRLDRHGRPGAPRAEVQPLFVFRPGRSVARRLWRKSRSVRRTRRRFSRHRAADFQQTAVTSSPREHRTRKRSSTRLRAGRRFRRRDGQLHLADASQGAAVRGTLRLTAVMSVKYE